MREIEQHDDGGRGPRAERAKMAAAARGRGDEQRHQADENETRIGREQQEAERQANGEPVRAAAIGERPIGEQKRQPDQRQRQNRRAEFDRRHREDADAGHQQDRHRGMRGADHAAAEREYRPIGDDDTNLRQEIEADDSAAGKLECDLGKPVRERGAVGRAELPFVADGQHERDVAGRRGVEQ